MRVSRGWGANRAGKPRGFATVSGEPDKDSLDFMWERAPSPVQERSSAAFDFDFYQDTLGVGAGVVCNFQKQLKVDHLARPKNGLKYLG